MRRWLRRLAVIATATLVPLGAGFLWFLHRAAEPAHASPPAGSGIAVLTGGPDRVEAGLLLLATQRGARLIISGAGRDSTLPDLMRGSGVMVHDPAALAPRISLGRTATSTHGNAREVADWARVERLRAVTVVTAGFHMPRALLELGRAMPGVALYPHPVPPYRPRPTALLREYAKLLGAAAGLSALVGERREGTR